MIPSPSSTDLATRPNNEERRAQAVVKTGLIDAPNSDLFQIYCDLAKDLTGYEQAKFSLFDGESQCSMGAAGVDDSYEVGAKTERSKWNVCSYVLLDTEPIIVEDFYLDKDWAEHPYIKSGDAPHSYAGFPVINKDNYALGTLCLFNTERKKLPESQVELIKKITTKEYPGYPTDLQAQIIATLLKTGVKSRVTENIFENRFIHIPELRRFGADLKLKDKTVEIQKVSELYGAEVMATDIRASFSLIIAAIMAKGTTTIDRIYHLDRGYEDFDLKLKKCGVNIKRKK